MRNQNRMWEIENLNNSFQFIVHYSVGSTETNYTLMQHLKGLEPSGLLLVEDEIKGGEKTCTCVKSAR